MTGLSPAGRRDC